MQVGIDKDRGNIKVSHRQSHAMTCVYVCADCEPWITKITYNNILDMSECFPS